MQINVFNPPLQTILFIIVFSIFIVLSKRPNNSGWGLTKSHTNSLKGVAILMVIFGHIGYFLSKENSFLYPLSTVSGVGVNIFLFLSGFGLSQSANNHSLTPLKFYLKRFPKLLVPMWFVLTFCLIIDAFVLKIIYDPFLLFRSFLGYFPTADIFTSIDSPLWYMSMIIFYYLLFPIFYRPKYAPFSALLIYLLAFIVLDLQLGISQSVEKLYNLHYLFFPLGILFSWLKTKISFVTIIKNYLSTQVFRLSILVILIAIFCFFAINSGVGDNLTSEQIISFISTLSTIGIIIFLPFESRIVSLFGEYSYEIYLFHWPILYRYDLIYKVFPAWLSTLIYLFLFLALGYLLSKLTNLKISKTKLIRINS